MPSNSFIAKMKSLGDELAAAGRPVTDGEMVDYILAGLDRDYDPIVAAVGAIKNLITVDDLFSQIWNRNAMRKVLETQVGCGRPT